MPPSDRPCFQNTGVRHTAAATLCCALACVPAKDLADYSELTSTGGAGGIAPSEPGSPPDPLDPDEVGEGVNPATTPLDPGETANGGNEAGAGGAAMTDSEPRGDAGVVPRPSADAAPLPLCAADEALGPDAHCYFFDATTRAWEAARSACRARGTGWDLASVLSAAESEFLGEQLPFEGWLGAADGASEGDWIWVADGRAFWRGSFDGAAVDGAYANWNTTEPNGSNTTNCARALPRSFGSMNPNAPWADLACTALRGAICERHL